MIEHVAELTATILEVISDCEEDHNQTVCHCFCFTNFFKFSAMAWFIFEIVFLKFNSNRRILYILLSLFFRQVDPFDVSLIIYKCPIINVCNPCFYKYYIFYYRWFKYIHSYTVELPYKKNPLK